jgi:hypothetical protein
MYIIGMIIEDMISGCKSTIITASSSVCIIKSYIFRLVYTELLSTTSNALHFKYLQFAVHLHYET